MTNSYRKTDLKKIQKQILIEDFVEIHQSVELEWNINWIVVILKL